MPISFKYQALLVVAAALFAFTSFNEESTFLGLRRLQQTREINRYLVHGEDKLRLAVFGSSNAWGAGLTDRFNAYPYLLSPEVDNYADFSAGPNYASVCAETLIGGDEMYDVIIFDYWLKAYQGLIPLAKRLRTRFPNAIMIFLRVWTPNHARRMAAENDTEPLSLEEWKNTLELPDNEYHTVQEALHNDTGIWFFPHHADADKIINDASAAVSGRVFSFEMAGTPKEIINANMGYFDKLTHAHVSDVGHEALADSIQKLVKDALDADTTVDQVNSAYHGSWGNGDACHLWFTTGATANAYDQETMQMIEYDDLHGKFALEVDKKKTGWFDVVNPFDDDRTLYVSFLASEEGIYPSVNATYNATGSGELTTVLDPTTDEDSKHVHIIKTVPLEGHFGHGIHRIYLTPTEHQDLHFRLVGDSFTDETTVPQEIGFGPAFNF